MWGKQKNKTKQLLNLKLAILDKKNIIFKA